MVKSGGDGFVHVVISISAEAAAKDEVRFPAGEFAVLGEFVAVGGGVDWVIWLVFTGPRFAVFADDDGLAGAGGVAAGGAFGVEMLKLVYASELLVEVGVVHDWATLKIVDGQDFFLEVEGAPLELAVLIVVKTVDRASVNGQDARPAELGEGGVGKIVDAETEVEVLAATSNHGLKPSVIAVHRKALVSIFEIIIIVIITDGEALDDFGREVFGGSLPLLGGVIFDERVKKGLADERDSLLGEVGRLSGGAGGLLGNLGASFGRGVISVEKLVYGAKIDGHGVDFALVGDVDFVDVVCERGELIDVIPDAFIRGVKKVSAVFVALDAGDTVELRGAVATDVVAAVDEEDAFTEDGAEALGHGQPKKTGPDDEDVIRARWGGLLGFPNGHIASYCSSITGASQP